MPPAAAALRPHPSVAALAAPAASPVALHELLEASLDAVWLLAGVRDAGGRLVDFVVADCNARAAAQVGAARGALVGHGWHALFPTPRARAMFAAYARVADTGVPYEAEFESTDPRVVARWLHVQAVRVGGGVAVTARDVTARKDAEAALRASEARHRALLEALPVIVYHAEPEPPYAPVYVSPAAEALGYPHASWMTRADFWLSILHPDDRDRVLAETERALAERGAVDYEYRVVAGDGGVRWIHDRGAFVFDSAGRAVAWQGVMVDVTAPKALEARLVRQATRDGLTGLANRDAFRARAEAALAAAAADPAAGQVVVLFLDLDDFKAVNDALGHAAGDALLVAAAERLLNATRGCDTVARLGGDEFAVLLQHVGGDADAAVVAERVAAALARPFQIAGREACTPASVGIAHAAPGDSADDLLRNADLAMYRAKAQGRDGRGAGGGGVAAFAPAMHAALVERVALAADVRRAVEATCAAPGAGAAAEAGVFSLAFQPIVALGDETPEAARPGGAEALLRWEHPARGPVSPAACVPVAEETGLIVPLGRWVLGAACRAAAGWAVGGGAPNGRDPAGPWVSVNVSARQLREAAFVGDVAAALAEAGLAPARLVLEITEGVLMHDTPAVLARLHALKALGVRLAVDDFGTGYSSLAYLHRFPLDVLKVDRAFVARLGGGDGGGDSGAALARTVLGLGAALGLRCVAEGVETAEQRDALRAMGCEWAQGYLFARPLGAAEAAARFAVPAPPTPPVSYSS